MSSKTHYLVLAIISTFLFSFQSKEESERNIAGSLVKVQSLGSSYKGKYIAIEEYGYRAGNIPYARIRVIDVWKDKEMVKIEANSSGANPSLSELRQKNRTQARSKVKKYKIKF